MSGELKQTIRREINYRREEIIGRVVTPLNLEDLDGNSSAVWVCDVFVSGNRVFRRAPVKAGADGSRFYAQVGQTVKLKQNDQGLWDVIGPGDKLLAFTTVKRYTIGVNTPVSTSLEGSVADCVDYDFYENDRPGSGGTESLYNDGVTDYPLCRVVDALGNEVT